jgi:hypothetical protein
MKLSIRPCPICGKDHDIETVHPHELALRSRNPFDSIVALLKAARVAEEAATSAAQGDMR